MSLTRKIRARESGRTQKGSTRYISREISLLKGKASIGVHFAQDTRRVSLQGRCTMKRATQVGTHMLPKTPVVWLDLVNPLSDQEISPGRNAATSWHCRGRRYRREPTEQSRSSCNTLFVHMNNETSWEADFAIHAVIRILYCDARAVRNKPDVSTNHQITNLLGIERIHIVHRIWRFNLLKDALGAALEIYSHSFPRSRFRPAG